MYIYWNIIQINSHLLNNVYKEDSNSYYRDYMEDKRSSNENLNNDEYYFPVLFRKLDIIISI